MGTGSTIQRLYRFAAGVFRVVVVTYRDMNNVEVPVSGCSLAPPCFASVGHRPLGVALPPAPRSLPGLGRAAAAFEWWSMGHGVVASSYRGYWVVNHLGLCWRLGRRLTALVDWDGSVCGVGAEEHPKRLHLRFAAYWALRVPREFVYLSTGYVTCAACVAFGATFLGRSFCEGAWRRPTSGLC